MSNAKFTVPNPHNEPIYGYLPNSPERKALKQELDRQLKQVVQIPIIIGGKEYYTDNKRKVTMPTRHNHVLAEFSLATPELLTLACQTAMQAKKEWAELPWEHRISIFLKVADLISNKYRAKLNASTMLGQGKVAFQAEIDSACEITDFLRFNSYYADQIYSQQPQNSNGVWNRMEYRPLDGFVAAISPFNFTAIGGNLPTSPAIMGNTVVWKPASTAMLSNYYYMRILEEAGLPNGVINFVPCAGVDASEYVLKNPDLAGFHFTGSTNTFQSIWKLVGNNIHNYHSYPRLVGETGGKDFVFAHNSADVDSLVVALTRGSFEYQGQKCSAASRAYIPASIWEKVKEGLLSEVAKIKMGDVCNFDNLMGAVIDKASFDNIKAYLDYTKSSKDAQIICGGQCDDSVGWFVSPTIIVTSNLNFKTLVEEVFGPVLTIYVYDDTEFEPTMESCDKASMYALTGSIFARDRQVLVKMEKALSNAAGNFYINDKPTGAVVGQQPFGGSRGSGTNDKAGSILNLYRWTSPRAIKETFLPATTVDYPYMQEK
ncbi:MAG: L-glutamate gamma-semialdehyde dehydrogenase [Clostridia bacterium]|nr:L-glutamate gamma-semialdehyde dehydrogenase [Clostridia bacterium]